MQLADTMATDDGFKNMSHYDRRGPICKTTFIPKRGYFWSHINSAVKHGPFMTRELAVRNECQ